MGDWDRREPQHAPGARSHAQLRSQSLPRLSSSQTGASVSSSSHGVTPAPPSPEVNARFERAARTVGDCLTLVKGLSPEVNSARAFREKCSNLLGAAIATTLAMQEALSSSYKATGSELAVQRLATDVQSKLLSADALVRKYGHETLISSMMRFEAKEDVERKFDGVIGELQALTNKTWDLIDPENRIKRDVVMQGPAASSSVKTGNAFARHTLRLASKYKVQALLAFPDEDGEGHDGVVAWAAHRNIKLVHLGSQVTTVLDGAGEYLVCMAYDKAGYIWSGHVDGTVRIWSLEGAAAAGSPIRVAETSITAVAVDPDTGYCWAGTDDGEVVVTRFNQQGAAFGKLEVVRQLLGYDAHTPATVDSGGSYASSSQAVPVSSSTSYAHSTAAASSTGSSWSSKRKRHKSRQQLKPAGHAHGTSGSLTGLDLLESCLGTHSTGGSGRVKDTCVHSGPVNSILISAGRAYTAGGSSGASASLLVWDSSRFELLRTISKRSTRWCRFPTTAMTMVYWAPSRRGSSTSSQLNSSGSLPRGDSTSSTVTTGPYSGVTGSARANSERHLVTGHTNGSVIMWDPTGDTLKPVLLVGPEKGSKQAVKSLVVLEELGVLACAHANGKVYMRKLDPKTRLAPRDDANVSRWNPNSFNLQVHRLGLHQMVGCGHLLVTTGKTGSVKLWPETQLRCRASEAGIQLPYSRNPLSEAVNALLSNAGLTAYASGGSMYQLPTLSPAASMALQASGQLSDGLGNSRQQHQRHKSDGSTLPSSQLGQYERSSLSDSRTLPQRQLQQEQQQRSDAAEAAAAVAANEQEADAAGAKASPRSGSMSAGAQQQQDGAGERGVQRIDSSKRWSRDLRENAWMLEWDSLGLDPSRRKVIGSGSYGRVEIGSFNQTDVAVKILTDVAKDGPSPTTPADCPSWDEARLRALRQEVGILATLRHPNVVLFMGVCLAPPAVVTEYCPLGSLYDVLKKARNGDRAMACRLTWTRRLLMALDAARGMLYLHSHKPTILHRDLKSPNLFVTNALHVKVGDFNLSRYMSLGASFVKSSLEINPRWNAPEVIADGYYSTAADVYAFGVVLWELLTWQEPWEEEGLGSFQIMIAVQQQNLRPRIPPLDELPGQLGPTEAVSGYLSLMQDCWAQNYMSRPGFEAIVTRLKVLLRMGGPNAAAGPGATAAAGAAGVAPTRNASDGALLAGPAAAAAVGAAPAADGGVAATTAAAADKVALHARHQHSKSEVVGAAAVAAAAAAAGPEIADLLQLGDDDDLPGPSAPSPPAAALPPIRPSAAAAVESSSHSFGSELLFDPAACSTQISSGSITPMFTPGESRQGSGSSPAVAGAGQASSSSQREFGNSISLSAGVADAAAEAAVAEVDQIVGTPPSAAAGLPPKPRQPGRAAATAAAAGGRPAAASSSRSPLSPFAAAVSQQHDDATAAASAAALRTQEQQQLQVCPTPPMPVSYGANIIPATGPGRPSSAADAGAAGRSASPFSSTAAQAGGSSTTAGVIQPPSPITPVAATATPFSVAGKSPIKASPFASPFAAAASTGGGSSTPLAVVDTTTAAVIQPNGSGSIHGSPAAGLSGTLAYSIEASLDAASAVDASTRAMRNSSSAGGASGSGSASQGAPAAAADAAVPASVVDSSGGAEQNGVSKASSAVVASLGAWGQQQQSQLPMIPPPPDQPPPNTKVGGSILHSTSGAGVVAAVTAPAIQADTAAGGSLAHSFAGSSSSSLPCVESSAADLISLDSIGLDGQTAGGIKLSQNNPFAAAAAGALR